MKSSLRAYLLSIVVACTVITGCAQDAKVTDADMRDRIGTELGTVERVTVMSTDGQEVSLDLPEFLKELQGQGKDLQLSNDPLKQEDVRFTLVLYRKQVAPLVVSVGEKASKFGENTYRGSGAITFYQWIHRLTGNGLLALKSDNILLSADDLSQARMLAIEETAYIQKVLQAAAPESDQSVNQHPLYPNYRLRIDSVERPLEVTVLTPTLISIPFGRDRHFYHVDGQMFSRLTEYLVPKEKTTQPIDKLFKATNIRVEATGEMRVNNLDLDVSQSTVEQGMAHQAVRLLKTGVQLVDRPQKGVGPEEYRLHFRVNGKELTVIFYSRHFRINDSWYAHNQLQKAIWKLIEPTQK
ncbi:hypothetical protein [Brevibacillus choshinensis]|uniref:hypothetical protein n=1 Tax=Brevibacillus choshinensis TaxID=54911 RepID=UPI002E1D0D28|nr:hypothetical protein [Brevibacillus choshinensis]MED4750107.1 hypothetical protein [Brevibacillus choshinensis]MED4780693.1 hypothetical protein [Brevibacillus choshinensis]